MGGADIVPGVSGGSIALITGIYEKLLDSIKAIDLDALKLLLKAQWRPFWEKVNGNFLLSLLAGILTSIFLLSRLITYLIENHPIPLWSFFCGLIIISAVLILRDIKKWRWLTIVAITIGFLIAFWVTNLPLMDSDESLLYTFLAGSIAICAMILPGISGSFILLILGQYEYILKAVNEKNLLTIFVFGLGCVLGLLSFSRLISWLLKNYHASTIGMLSGFMLGSINEIWPWKNVLSYRMSSTGIQKPFITENLLPQHYLVETGEDPLVLFAFLAFFFGLFLVIGIERMATYMKK